MTGQRTLLHRQVPGPQIRSYGSITTELRTWHLNTAMRSQIHDQEQAIRADRGWGGGTGRCPAGTGIQKVSGLLISDIESLRRLSATIPDWRGFPNHEDYVSGVREKHGRKWSFWKRVDD